MKTRHLIPVFAMAMFAFFTFNTARAEGGKVIDISINDQQMTVIENYKIVNQFPVSTGKWDMPTPIGTHQIYNHVTDAYSTLYDLYMPHWMAITPDGGYGIHGLPYWKYPWGNVYEGENHLGWRVSHGCVRLSLTNAAWLYNWAPNGTKVIVHDESGIQAPIIPPDYTAGIIEQSSPEITLKPGETATLKVKLKNTGLHWWYQDGTRPIHLGTTGPNDRQSLIADSSWLSPNRPANMSRSGIAGGEETEFTFTIKAPKQNGYYEEHFRPVADGYSWFTDMEDIVWKITVWQPEYSNQWVSQSDYPTVNKNETVAGEITFKNMGTETWYQTGPTAVHLATTHSRDRISPFYDSGTWLSQNRLASMEEDSVAPGETATFRFRFKAPNTPGLYTEYVGLVAENKSWMEDLGTFWNINVK